MDNNSKPKNDESAPVQPLSDEEKKELIKKLASQLSIENDDSIRLYAALSKSAAL
ncbi:MAG: hypothetical protein K0R29_1248 [Pseudobdellovibrio sp.]|jgi:hypothetical protein|nr:hypothetical protein [Pseudobdellovibrio sp.]